MGVVFVCLVVYGNALLNGFVYDDPAQIVQNPWIKDLRFIPEIITSNVWDFKGLSSNYYRPLMHLINMISYHFFGLASWGYHAVNILFHAGVSILVFIISSRLLTRSWRPSFTPVLAPSFVAAVLFATHPIHTEAVTWISGLPDVSCTFFYLLSFYLYIVAFSENHDVFSKGTYVLSLGCFFLAACCKETALTLPLILVFYDYAFQKKSIVSHTAKSLKRYVPFFLVVTAYLLVRVHFLGSFAPSISHPELSTRQYMINILPLFVQYVGKILFPVNLTIYHPMHLLESLFGRDGIISLSLALTFFVLLFVAAKKNKAIFFSLVLIVIPLLPALYIPAIEGNFIGERYLYLPSVGFALLLAFCIDRLLALKGKWPSAAVATASLVLLCLYSYGTVTRNLAWRDDASLWADAVKKSPDDPNVYMYAGYWLYETRPDEAKVYFRNALRLEPYLVEGLLNAGVAASKIGLIDKAIYTFDIAGVLAPDNPQVHYNLGIAFSSKGWLDPAIKQYQLAIRLKADYADAYNNLGIAYSQKGLIDAAIGQFQAALRLKPGDIDYHYNIAHVYQIKGLQAKAEDHRRLARSLAGSFATENASGSSK
jgi:tetratricopeptide (TPR) repeat protein